MVRNNIPNHAVAELDGTIHAFHGHLAGRMQWVDPATGALFVASDAQGVVQPIDDAQFDRMLLEGRARLINAPSRDRRRHLNDVSQWTIAQAAKIDPAVEKMLKQCDMLDEAGVPNGRKAIGRHLAKHWDADLRKQFGEHDSPATIERWRSERGHPGSRHASQMVRMNGKAPRSPYCADAPAEILQKHALELWVSKAKFRDGYAGYRAEMESVNEGRHPDYVQPDEPYDVASGDTLRRRVNALEQASTTAAKRGKQAVEQDWMGAGRPLTADFAMQRVIIDHTRLDLFVVYVLPDGEEVVLGRPWLTLAICVATRAVVAHLISFIPPCTWTVGEIIRRMAMPKRPPAEMEARYPILRQLRGKPVELVVDNAVEFRSHMMEAAACSAGFGVRFCPVKKPRYRAVGERAMGTVNRLICDGLPGRTIAPSEARRIEYDAEKDALVLMEELEAIANMAVAVCNTEPHGGRGGRPPALMFQRDAARNGINNFVDLDGFRRDLMAIEERRQLGPAGIVAFGGLRYGDFSAVPALLGDLVPLECRRRRGEDATATVDFRYDPMDISRIHVWNRKRRTYVELQCSDERYADGMPLFVHDMIREQAKRDGEAFNTPREREAARNRLLQAKINVDPNERARIREEMARLYDVPRIREVTGNIVHLETRPGEHCDLADFIGHERAALTSFDHEILSTRPEPRPRKEGRRRRDPRDAGREPARPQEQTAPPLRRRKPKGAGK